MRREELLFKDLCARLPYRTLCKVQYGDNVVDFIIPLSTDLLDEFVNYKCEVKPYLRSMLYMTNEEMVTYERLYYHRPIELIDFINSYHLDYRNLIEKGFAIEAPEDMYKFE